MGILFDTAHGRIHDELSQGMWAVKEAHVVYRPRSPQKDPFYRIFNEHFEHYTHIHEERFAAKSGHLRPIVAKSVEEFLDCGLLHGGFARIRCPSCHEEHLLAFSCQTRNFCPSCQSKRGALLAEKLSSEVFYDVPHRHIIFTIPIVLRGIFERERKLLGILSKSAFDATSKVLAQITNDKHARCGFVSSIQTFGSFAANFHPHIHAIVTAGVFSKDGDFTRIGEFPTSVIEEVFRKLLLARLHQAERLSESFMLNLMSWVHSGFSVHAKHRIEAGDSENLEKMARYATRAPIRLTSIEITARGKVLAATPRDHRTGKTSLVLDPVEFIHQVANQIPDPRMHLVRYYGVYANRVRKDYAESTSVELACDDEPDDLSVGEKKSRASWARLIS